MKRLLIFCTVLMCFSIAALANQPTPSFPFEPVTTTSYAFSPTAELLPAPLSIIPASEKSPFVAGLLSFFVPGAGQWYAGNFGRGLIFFGSATAFSVISYITYDASPTISLVSSVALTGVWIWSIFDARKMAKRTRIAIGDGIYLDFEPSIQSMYTFNNRQNCNYGMTLSLKF
ncbi:MAG: hypothetical protein M0R23_07215 [Bacteroidales bacterium]|nr:hypothetical protein [Bacteroidales bacterium]